MFEMTEQQKRQLAELCRRFEVKRLDLFGSATTDEFKAESDLDFVVEFVPEGWEGAADRYFGLLFALEELFGRKIDLVTRRSIRNPFFRRGVESTRRLVYAA